MDSMHSLRAALLDLVDQTRNADLRLIVGGGYEIYLKREHVQQTKTRTLFSNWPETRSTNDLDLFLRPELLISSTKLRPLADALSRLGYQVIPEAAKYQFIKPGPTGNIEGSLKVDLLTAPESRFHGTAARVDSRRVRPQPSVELHAHPVNEALTLEEELFPLKVSGSLSSGDPFEAEIYLPHPFTFAMMKLFALRDRAGDSNKDFGRYHALDLYTIVALMDESEWEQAIALRAHRTAHMLIREAGMIAHQYFSAPAALGMIRIRESPYYHDSLQLPEFSRAICDLFPRS